MTRQVQIGVRTYKLECNRYPDQCSHHFIYNAVVNSSTTAVQHCELHIQNRQFIAQSMYRVMNQPIKTAVINSATNYCYLLSIQPSNPTLLSIHLTKHLPLTPQKLCSVLYSGCLTSMRSIHVVGTTCTRVPRPSNPLILTEYFFQSHL